MNLIKRDCGIRMRLIPYGGGWTDLYADFGDGEIHFIISNVMEAGFESLMRALYYLHPMHCGSGHDSDIIDYKYGICERVNGEYAA